MIGVNGMVMGFWGRVRCSIENDGVQNWCGCLSFIKSRVYTLLQYMTGNGLLWLIVYWVFELLSNYLIMDVVDY